MSLRLRNINSLNVKQENEIMAKAVAGVKNINIGKPANKAKNITFERKATVIAGKSLKENVVQRTALGELSNKILSRDEDSTSTTNIVKKEVVKTRSLAVAAIHKSLNKVENREVEKPEPKSYSSQRLEGNLRDIDKQSGDCQILLGYYAEDIYSYLRDLEIKFPISPTFMSQLQINSKMRSILVDWLVEVHQQFALLPETLYVTISILDRFLQVEKTVQRKYLQLVGISAMFVASKYEEMCSPDVQDFVYISDSAYSKEQILKMEQHILMKLEFKLGQPVPLHFLRRFSRAADVSDTGLGKEAIEHEA
uniref:Cyclin-like domain-containing protein n=1 Tax=Timema tahoe TaxID=61484 RepID=A0A7R9FJH8_9NEOP|nr:unnamed protein product [Timema tahoe]